MFCATRTLTKKGPAVAVEEAAMPAMAEMAARLQAMKREPAAAVEAVATKPLTTRAVRPPVAGSLTTSGCSLVT